MQETHSLLPGQIVPNDDSKLEVINLSPESLQLITKILEQNNEILNFNINLAEWLARPPILMKDK